MAAQREQNKAAKQLEMTAFVQRMESLSHEHDNRINSPLLRLPAELRNAIYGYVFADQTFQLRTFCKPPRPGTQSSFLGRPDKGLDKVLDEVLPTTLLFSVCRQLYIETRILYISESEFIIHRNMWMPIIPWWNKLEDSRKNEMRYLRFVDNMPECHMCWKCKMCLESELQFIRDTLDIEGVKKLKRVVFEIRAKDHSYPLCEDCQRAMLDNVPDHFGNVKIRVQLPPVALKSLLSGERQLDISTSDEEVRQANEQFLCYDGTLIPQ